MGVNVGQKLENKWVERTGAKTAKKSFWFAVVPLVTAYCGYQLCTQSPSFQTARRYAESLVQSAEQNMRVVGTEAALCDSSMPDRLANATRTFESWPYRTFHAELSLAALERGLLYEEVAVNLLPQSFAERHERILRETSELRDTPKVICDIFRGDAAATMQQISQHTQNPFSHQAEIPTTGLAGQLVRDIQQLGAGNSPTEAAEIRQARERIRADRQAVERFERQMQRITGTDWTNRDDLGRYEYSRIMGQDPQYEFTTNVAANDLLTQINLGMGTRNGVTSWRNTLLNQYRQELPLLERQHEQAQAQQNDFFGLLRRRLNHPRYGGYRYDHASPADIRAMIISLSFP